jgi:lipoate-protein ligase B
MPYEPAFAIQERILEARMGDRLPSTIILQENASVFTIGRSGSRSNILASADELQKLGIEVLEANRGGDITYHGPGQLIVSPLLYLGDVDLNANQYLHRLEDVLIDLLSTFGIRTYKKKDYPGVWWNQAKVGAVGIAVKHGYTFHGFSLNVNLDLAPFNLINPCGVSQMLITSLHQILGHEIPMAEIKNNENQFISRLAGSSMGQDFYLRR